MMRLEVPDTLPECREDDFDHKRVGEALGYSGRHSNLILCQWDKLVSIISAADKVITVDGASLDIASIVAIARYVILHSTTTCRDLATPRYL